MSFEVSTYEMLEVNASNETVKGFIKNIVDYIEQFNKMKSLESLSGFRMTITADGSTTALTCDSESERNNTYMMTEKGIVENTAEHNIWSAEEIENALRGLETASAIKLETTFSVFQLLDYKYGFSYWKDFLDENSGVLRENISYKCIEYYDTDPGVVVYKFEKDFAGFVSYESEAEDVAYINSWYSSNFELKAYSDEDYNAETVAKIMTLSERFAEKYDFINEVEEPFENEFMLLESMRFSGDFTDLAADIQEIVDVLVEAGAEIEFTGTFIPNDRDTFAAVNLTIDEGKVWVEYCKC